MRSRCRACKGTVMSEKKHYTYRSMREEREYGFYWYSTLWKILRPILIGVTVVVLVCGILYSVWTKVYDEWFSPVDMNDSQEVVFEIASGQSLTKVANNLENAGLIRNHTVFKYYCDFAGMGQKIQIGHYVLSRDMTVSQIADRLTTGDGNPIVRNITLIPGQSVEEFADYLLKNGVLADQSVFLEKCRTGADYRDYYYIDEMLNGKNAAGRRYALEGYLAPNTYEIYTNATEDDIIRKLLSQTEAVFPVEYQERAAEMSFTMDEILTLASLIEKEAKESDFAKVSAVFHNRLKVGMKIQSDVTIHYITGVPKMALGNSDLNIDSPYNTYLYEGLPLGPVCNPSPQAIKAALYPDESFLAEKYLFFCAKEPESGELYFSRTLQEHEQAVAIYAPLWQAYDDNRGIQ